MAKLLLLVACENFIISQTNNLSLINLLQDLEFDVLPGTELPSSAAIPMKWGVVSVWQREATDQGKTYEQKFVLLLPNGSNVMESPVVEMTFPQLIHRSMTELRTFPISQVGEFRVLALLRERGAETWNEIGSYSIRVSRRTSR